jgi:hypothetical protein
MKKIIHTISFAIVFFLILSAVKGVEWGTVYSLDMEIFKDDRVILQSITASNGTTSYFPTSNTGYSIRTLSSDGRELFSANLGVSFTIIFDNKVSTRDSTSINVRVPFSTITKYISIYKGDREISRIDLSKSLCNNNSICEAGENPVNCQHDCAVKGGVGEMPWLYMIIAAVAAVALVIYLIRKNYTLQV